MKARTFLNAAISFAAVLNASFAQGQGGFADSNKPERKNVVRYNLSSALFFGPGTCVIFGYERVIRPQQSISVNAGTIALPKVLAISTDSFNLNRNTKRNGFNASVDYRFYLAKENKYRAPRGLYVGPFYSYNLFKSSNSWSHRDGSGSADLVTDSKFQIHTFGGEVGYQMLLWDRVTLDLVMVGPGISTYKLQSTITGSLNLEDQEQLQNATLDLITQKFPGLKTLFEEKKLDKNGTISTWNFGYRYLIHIGFNF